MKKVLSIVFVLSLFIFGVLMTNESYAYNKCGIDKGSSCKMTEKFFKKIHLVCRNQEELKITEKQMEEIKKLKIDTKKMIIKKTAELELITLDVKQEFWKDSIDKKNIDKLIDKKFDIKKSKAKALISAFIEFKNILSEKQMIAMKNICKKNK